MLEANTEINSERSLTAPVNEILVGLALFASASLSILATRVPGGIALLWPGSAIAAAVLIRLPRVRWSIALVALFAALLIANVVVAHRPWSLATLFAFTNVIEIAMMVAAFRFAWRFPYPDITVGQAAIMTALFGIAIPGLSAILGGIIQHHHFSLSILDGTLQWWSSHAVGACLLGPPVILFSVKGIKRLVRPGFLAENILTLLVCLAGTYLTIRYVRFPFVSIGMLLLIAALRIGGFGASLLSLCCGLTITNLWILGIRPMGLDPALPSSGSLIGLPIIALIATIIPPIAVGLGGDARRAAGRALRVSERRFRESMQHSPIGMLISNLDGIWAYTNLALQEMLGYSEEEFRAMPPGGPSRPEDWNDSAARWKRLVSGETESYNTVRCFQHQTGRWVWTHVAVSLLRDEDGTPIHLIAQIESLEARQRAEEKLADERERLKITLQSINDAVITTDANARIAYINAAAESLLGLDVDAVQNRRVDEVIFLMDPRTSKAAANLIGQSTLHGKVFRREQPCLLHRPDGTIRYVSDVVSPVLDSTGAVSGLVIVFRDATLEVDRDRELHHRAMHDPLTGLINRNEFDRRLRASFEKAHHLARPAALMAIDLDRFKALNDAAGHAAGDAMLRKAADACLDAVRASDSVARLGGDEFAIIIDNCGAERAAHIAQQLLGTLNPLALEWEGTHYDVGACIGLALTSVGTSDEKAWLEAADKACYGAKREGRGALKIAL
jgi:diguanylate cyclase (GGDEF)-like protein/PAS domain S-box-containing protein